MPSRGFPFAASALSTITDVVWPGKSPTHFSGHLTALFEAIALIISQHQPVVEKYYGPGKMLLVAARLLAEADRIGLRVALSWADERRVRGKVADVREYRFAAATARPPRQVGASPLVGGVEEDKVDPREVDALLAELAMMSGRWQLLRRFLYDRLKARLLPPFCYSPKACH